MIGSFLLYLMKWAFGLALGAFVLKLAAIGGDMVLARAVRPRHKG